MKMRRLSYLLAGFVWSCLAMATEEPAHRVLERDGAYEIREYAAMTVAETVARAQFDAAGNSAFRTLFGYISGGNARKEDIAMTAPVRQEAAPEGGFRIGFVTPSKYTLASAPAPADARVSLREVPPQRMAVLRYSGRWTEKNFRDHEAKLRAWMDGRSLVAAGDPVYARYNAPFVPWPFRRNEVMIPLQ